VICYDFESIDSRNAVTIVIDSYIFSGIYGLSFK